MYQSSTFEIELTVDSGTVQSPMKRELKVFPPYLTSIGIYNPDGKGFGAVYYRILSGPEVIYPRKSLEPAASGVPGGWAAVTNISEQAVNILLPGPDRTLTVELIDTSAVTTVVLFKFTAAYDTVESLLVKILDEIRELKQVPDVMNSNGGVKHG